MWNKVYKTADIMRFRGRADADHNRYQSTLSSYSLALIGLETVHVVGAADAPSTQELQQVDFHRGLHEDKVVVWHAEARKRQGENVKTFRDRAPDWQKTVWVYTHLCT